MTSWSDPTPIAIPDDLREAIGGHPVVAERLVRGGITTPQAAQRFLLPATYIPASPYDLPDMAQAVSLLQQAIQQQKRLLVWGDFDVDGQTSTALLVAALRDLGAQVTFHIPNRFTEGHGISLSTLPPLLEGVDVLLTCDTGITAHEAIDYAQSHGVTVIITDHHALPQVLPQAAAVINPMRLPAGHPMRELPGVGTAYQLIRALYGDQSTDHLLDLVAVGIVADVMVLVDDTRYWLQRGLEILRTNPRPGFKAILERANIDPINVTESDIGFALGPRLNALGRLSDANSAVDLLTTHDQALIAEQVNELEGLNQQRRLLTQQVYDGAQKQIADDPSLLKYAALVVSGEGWHTGVVGIVASRLVNEYGCPVIVLSEDKDHASGSARSVAGCNIIEAIHTQAALLDRYGGHTMAAGLSLSTDNIFAFRRRLSQVVRETLGKTDIQPQRHIDAYVDFSDITLAFADDIGRLAPFGNGNPALTLATRRVRVKSQRTLDRRGDHLELKIEDEAGHEQRVIWWSGDSDAVPIGLFDLAYTVRPNIFKGQREALIEWVEARSIEGETFLKKAAPSYIVLDYRQNLDPYFLLKQIQDTYEDVLVWREGVSNVGGVDRYHLHKAQTLVVWTMPADPFIWQSALQAVQPKTLILFAQSSPFDQPQSLLSHIAGLLKYAYQRKGARIQINDLAGLTGHTEKVIQVCIQWFNHHSEFLLTPLDQDLYQINQDKTRIPSQDKTHLDRLQQLIIETNAYRHYWKVQAFNQDDLNE